MPFFLGLLMAGLLYLLPAGNSARADPLDFEASSYYCKKIGGQPQGGNECAAEYKSYPRRACKVYDQAPEQDDNQNAIVQDAKSGQCNPDTIVAAKRKTLKLRADLMGYVSLGNDEAVNDPVKNTSMLPVQDGTVPYWPLMNYLANECAIQTCSGGESSSAEGNSETETPQSSQDLSLNAPQKPQVKSPLNRSVQFCNRTQSIAYVFIARLDQAAAERTYDVKGWYQIPPRKCMPITKLPVEFFYYGHAKGGKEWPSQGTRESMRSSPSAVVCAPNDPFSRKATDKERRNDCEAGMKMYEMAWLFLNDEQMVTIDLN